MDFKVTTKFFSVAHAQQTERYLKKNKNLRERKRRTIVSKLSSSHLKPRSLQAIIDRKFTKKVSRHEIKAVKRKRSRGRKWEKVETT